MALSSKVRVSAAASACAIWNVVPEHSVRISQALKANGVPVQQYFHQGGHGGFGAFFLQNRWFSRYLYGVPNGVENDPRAWIVREGSSQANPTPYADYPNPAAETVTLVPHVGGTTTGGLTSLALPDAAAETLVDAGNVALVKLPWTGGSECTSSTRRTTTSIVTRGWADPQNHASLTDGEPLRPGRFYDVTFDLQPDDQVIPAGSRLGLMVFATDAEFTLRPQPGTELTVDLAGTSVELPVVGGPLAMGICGERDSRGTVVVGGVDSGVPNHPLAGTCTINDHTLDDELWRNHGQFVAYITGLGDRLVAEGVITQKERAAVIRAAAQSDVGNN